MKIIIGNKSYSSWSLRAWVLLKAVGAEFEEVKIHLSKPDTHKNILQHSPSGKVPALVDGEVAIWDTMAIAEYLHEKYPKSHLWPKSDTARAFARSACAEMHSGFVHLRSELPTNFRFQKQGVSPSPACQNEIDRIIQILGQAQLLSRSQSWLLGDFGIIDAFYMPVMNRFHTYSLPLPDYIEEYKNRVLGNPWYKEWCTAARLETEIILDDEVGQPLEKT